MLSDQTLEDFQKELNRVLSPAIISKPGLYEALLKEDGDRQGLGAVVTAQVAMMLTLAFQNVLAMMIQLMVMPLNEINVDMFANASKGLDPKTISFMSKLKGDADDETG